MKAVFERSVGKAGENERLNYHSSRNEMQLPD